MTAHDVPATPGSLGVRVLIVTAGARTCALPLHYVSETMRPRPVEPVAGTPPFVRGVSVIRGAAVPVVNLAALLDRAQARTEPRRFVTVKTEGRQFALAVDDVVGVRDLDPARLEALPPLLRAAEADQIEAIGVEDERLLLVLRGSRIVPADVWQAIATPR